MKKYDVLQLNWELGSVSTAYQRLLAEASDTQIILPNVANWEAMALTYELSLLDFQLMLYDMLLHAQYFPGNTYISWDVSISSFKAIGSYLVRCISFSDEFSEDREPYWTVFCDGFRYSFVSTIRKE